MKSTSIACITSMWTLGLVAAPALGQEAGSPEAVEMKAAIQRLMEVPLAPGLAVAAVRGRETVFLKGFGYADVEAKRPVTPDSVFYIASATKPFVGTAAAILDHRGVLDLDGTLAAYIPDAAFHDEIDAKRITMRDLLTHTHGLENSGPITFRLAFSGQHTPALLKRLLKYHGPAKNGRAFEYGNLGYDVFSMAMEAKLGLSWKEVLRRELFDPLGMESTTAYMSRISAERLVQPYREEPEGFARGHYSKDDSNMHAAGGLVTTARDLSVWLEVNLNQGSLAGQQVIPQEVLAEVHRPQAEQDNAFGPFTRKGYGLGWHVGTYDGEAMRHHFGGFLGFHAHISFLPERKVGVVALANTAGLGSMLATAAAESMYDVLLDRADRPKRLNERVTKLRKFATGIRKRIKADRERRAARPQTLPHPLSAYVGTYASAMLGSVTLEEVNGKLEASMGPLWSSIEVFDPERNALRVELTGGGEVMYFHIPEDADRADGFTWDDEHFQRVDPTAAAAKD